MMLLAAALVLLVPMAAAQYSSQNKKAVQQFERGMQMMPFDITGAFKCFDKALKADPDFAEVHMTMAEWYLEHDSLVLAQQHYEHFLKTDKRHKRWQETARRGLKCIDFRRHAVQHPVPFTPVNMGPNVNSADNEYLPTLTADGRTLVFTRRFPRTEKTEANSPEEEDFYQCVLQDNGQWSKAQRMAEPLNSYDNEGAACISQDGRMMIFTACGRKDGRGHCDLYRCIWSDGANGKDAGWRNPRNMGSMINSGGWESQPSLSIDGRTLYFVSDRPDGYGGLDIWMSTLVDGRWSRPVNLGPTINTSGDEKSPFIAFDNKTLYFASDGHVGMGGMDLFVATRVDDSTWSAPENLGYPINTLGDESSLIVSPDGTTALFSSDQFGGLGQLDLYSFELPAAVRPEPVVYQEEIIEVAPTLEVGMSITLNNVFFETGKYALFDISIMELDKVVSLLQQHPTMRIELEGHTDNVGNASANQKLSEQRAKAVYDYLVEHGIAADRLSYKGYGQERPVADNSTAQGRAQNRRTAFTIIEK